MPPPLVSFVALVWYLKMNLLSAAQNEMCVCASACSDFMALYKWFYILTYLLQRHYERIPSCRLGIFQLDWTAWLNTICNGCANVLATAVHLTQTLCRMIPPAEVKNYWHSCVLDTLEQLERNLWEALLALRCRNRNVMLWMPVQVVSSLSSQLAGEFDVDDEDGIEAWCCYFADVLSHGQLFIR